MTDTAELSLRERKKRATGQELAATAFRLVRERGYDAVTIDEIAADAGYSRRTFANHYAGKADAVVEGFLERVAPEPGALAASQPETFDELVDATRAYLLTLLEGDALDDLRDFVALAATVPGLEATAQARFHAFRTSAVHERLAGTFGRTHLTFFLGAVIGLLGGAFHILLDELGVDLVPGCQPGRAALDLTSSDAHRERLREILDQGVEHLRHGFVRAG